MEGSERENVFQDVFTLNRGLFDKLTSESEHFCSHNH